MREQIFAYIKKKYKADPEFPWQRFPNYAVFRHADNRKWFGLVMDVPRYKLGLPGEDWVDILNVKVDDPIFADMLTRQEGFLPGYHISKGNWISILLDGTVSFDEVCRMIDTGFLATASKKKKQKMRPPKEWVIPSNPKYYDIVHAFDHENVIDWKQGSGINKGDTVYMYVGAPVSAILFKCKVIETDIPCQFQNKNLTIKALMKIRLQKRYPTDRFTFDTLKKEYGIYAVRGPRGIPAALSRDLNK